MSDKDNGGSAFPYIDSEWNPENQRWDMTAYQGMSLRDYFAAKYIAGCAADPSAVWTDDGADGHAKTAYMVADAMLKAREE